MARLFSNDFDSFKVRKEAKISIKKKMFIAFEGNNTEPNYFERISKHLNDLGGITVQFFCVNRKQSDTLSHPRYIRDGLIEYYSEEIKSEFIRKLDKLWIVFDIDKHFVNSSESVKTAYSRFLRSLITKDGVPIHAAVSNPCFELWQILQFEQIENLNYMKIALNPKAKKTSYIKQVCEKLRTENTSLSEADKLSNALNNVQSTLIEKDVSKICDSLGTNVHELFMFVKLNS